MKNFGIVVMAVLVLAPWVLLRKSPESSLLKARASKIYRYDSQHPGVLPQGRVAALSFAIGFHNYAGADSLIRELERKIKN